MLKKNKLSRDQSGGITHKDDMNAGSDAFNKGSEQDPDFDKGTKVSGEEKRTGYLPSNLGTKNEKSEGRKR